MTTPEATTSTTLSAPASRPLSLPQWQAAPPILDTLLALCEPPGWDLSPPQRVGRRHSTLNVTRLWTLIERIQADMKARERHCGAGRLRVVCPDLDAWHWESWRYACDPGRQRNITVTLSMKHDAIIFTLRVLDAPALMRKLDACVRMVDHAPDLVTGDSFSSPTSWIWNIRQGVVPVAYPQARALIAALVFSSAAEDIYVGTGAEVRPGEEAV